MGVLSHRYSPRERKETTLSCTWQDRYEYRDMRCVKTITMKEIESSDQQTEISAPAQ
jgi:hypothetical protein